MVDQISNISPCLRAACINGLIGVRKKKMIWELVKKNKVDVKYKYKLLNYLDIIHDSRMPVIFEISKTKYTSTY